MLRKPIIRYNGLSHKLLLMSKFYNKEVNYLDIRYLNPIMSRNFSDIKRALFRLECHGFIMFSDKDKTIWRITETGIQQLYLIADSRKVKNK